MTVKEACRQSFGYFFEKVTGLVLSDFHKNLIKELVNNQNILILAPRCSGKSSLTQAYVAWVLTNQPDSTIVVVAAKMEGARTFLRAVRNLLESESYTRIFGNVIDNSKENNTNTLNVFRTKGNNSPHPSLSTYSPTGNQITGRRSDFLVLDDICTMENCDAKSTENLIAFIETSLLPTRMSIKTPIKVLGTRWGLEDVYSYLQNRKDIVTKVYSAIDANGNSFWPEKHPIESLLAIKESTTDMAWSSQYMNSTDCMIRDAKFRSSDLVYYDTMPDLSKCVVHCGVDPAISQKADADDFVITVAAMEPQSQNIYIIDWKLGIFPFDKQVQLIEEIYKLYNCKQATIESVNYQEALVQHLMRRGINAVKKVPKGSKEERLTSLLPYLKSGRILIPRNYSKLISEWAGFGQRGVKDDCLDSMYYSVIDLIGNKDKPSTKFISKNSARNEFDLLMKAIV